MLSRYSGGRPEGIHVDAAARWMYVIGAGLDPGDDIPTPKEGRLREFLAHHVAAAEIRELDMLGEEWMYRYLRMGQRERGARVLRKPRELSGGQSGLW